MICFGHADTKNNMIWLKIPHFKKIKYISLFEDKKKIFLGEEDNNLVHIV